MASVDVTTPLKRLREDPQAPQLEGNKKHKPYNHILSFLNDEEEDPTQDISSLITTLHQEISDHLPPLPTDPQENPSTAPINSEDSSASSTSSVSDDTESVMRHLLEASDDELGIPATGVVRYDDEVGVSGVEFVVCDGLWEFEDEAANYYTLLQSELFM